MTDNNELLRPSRSTDSSKILECNIAVIRIIRLFTTRSIDIGKIDFCYDPSKDRTRSSGWRLLSHTDRVVYERISYSHVTPEVTFTILKPELIVFDTIYSRRIARRRGRGDVVLGVETLALPSASTTGNNIIFFLVG